MLASLALIFLAGLLMAAVCQRMKLPRIIGMLLSGVVLGPYALNLLDPSILSVSADLRQMALIIILLKAGLSLNLSDLKAVGRPAVLLSFVPACFEILAVVLFAPLLLGVAGPEAAVMGAVLGAVSPAVVIPRMVRLIETGYGTHKSIPQMIMAAASCDDVFVIVLFSTFVSMAQGGVVRLTDVLQVPVSIVLGIALGAAVGYALYRLFETAHTHKRTIRNSTKTVIILGAAFLLIAAEAWTSGAVCANPVQVFQAEYRFLLSAVFLLSILSLSFSCRALQWVFSNRIMRFLAAISYNLYIWHQWIAVRLKDWRIPYWEGDTLPNMAGNRIWQWEYTLLVFALSIGLAALVTYAFERPVSRRLLARFGTARGGSKPLAKNLCIEESL